MRKRTLCALAALLACHASACYRVVEEARPAGLIDCPSPPGGPLRIGALATAGALASLTGRVYDVEVPGPDTVGVRAAQIILPTLARKAVADSAGSFRLDSVPPGRLPMRITALGFGARFDTLEFAPGREVRIDAPLGRHVYDGCPGSILLVSRRRVWRWPWQ